MSARKPLARMDSPAVTEGTTDDVPVPADVKEDVLKTEPTENGSKTDTATEEKDIKEEKLETNDTDSILTQVDPSGPFDSKRVTRNSPMLIGSPLKKSSQENDSLSETPSAADEAPKKSERSAVGRPRKQSDTTHKSSGITVPPTNRLTRKAAEQQLAANTRFTRARRASAGIGARPETPPKRRNIGKTKIEPPAPAVKRKRSASPKLADEPDIKVQKAEEQEADFELNAVIVKQEVLESSEEMASDVASDITEPFPSRISLRARKSATCYSPTTRSYRREKDKEKKEESTITDGKRKRLTRVRPDEDSKDSLASSTMDDMVEIKIEEKFESEDANEAILPAIPSFEESATVGAAEVETNGDKTEDTSEPIDLPLTVDTTETITPVLVENTDIQPETDGPSTSAASNSSDKAASLSPDLVSEGVSEISVKQFYKKPEFLKNNLGIENDPKLGEIVQNVAEKMGDAADEASVSNDSIKEGELVFEEEDETASIGSPKNDNEDANSVSTGLNSPLVVEEEDEDEDANIQLASQIELKEKTDAKVEDEDKDKEKDIDIKEDVDTKEVVSDNGPVDCKSEELLVEEKLESSLKAVLDDIEKMETDETETSDNTEAPKSPIKEEKKTDTPDEETQDAEKEDVKDEKVEEIEKEEKQEIITEEFKTEEITIEENMIDQEENKENVGLMIKSVKEGVQEVSTTPENDHDGSMSTDEQESPCGSSKTSPSKIQADLSGEGTTPSTSPQSSKSSSVPRTPENDERLRQKERHLKTLGLLTHKAADEAKMAKQKRRKFLHNISSNSGSKKTTNANVAANTGSAVGNAQNKSSQEYTGTLKTVIKLNRQSGGGGANEPKKGKNVDNTGAKVANAGCGSRRQSLKMTFQKGRGRPANTEKSGEHPANTSGEDSYYTIQNEGEGVAISTSSSIGETTNTTTTAAASTTTTAHGRKSYNRSNTSDASHHHAEHHEVAVSKKDEKEEILIPEKASSFKFHPGRLCQDQCYYCSGKFGLYDTPCHVGQIKSVERQQKILANEEKLTVDNCLCDACFRHVDRRANVPSYKKRLSAPGHIETVKATTPADDSPNEQEKTQQQQQKPPPPSHANGSAAAASQHTCAVPDCNEKAAHSLRRKGIRKSIKKSLLNFDMSTAGTYLHICEKHYEAVVQSSGCVLCKRRLGKSNMYHITTDTDRLEKALADMGIPVALGQGTAVCKLCRYFANLLMKPPENGKVQKVQFVKNYRKRLFQFYNIHDKKDTSNEDSEEEKCRGKTSSKKQSTPSTSKRATRNSRTPEEEAKEVDDMDMDMGPPSPAHSTGSSVEMISDGNIFNADDESTVTPNIPAINAASNQMVLDNDVMVDYDVPMLSNSSSSSNSTSPSPQRMKDGNDQQSKLKAILQSNGTSLEDRNDISNVLRSNPNISMRELFPGEEDLGLQFKAPFGSSSSQRTPEGWIRVNTFLQYDEPTRRLWEELQKPYGNQSSFLRHLILLEKYYRNGDLVLSSTASSNASVYSRTVRNRLTSFDSQSSVSSSPSKELECRSRSLSVDKIQRQLSSNSVTITARPKEPKIQQKEDESPQKDAGSNCSGGGTGGPAPAKSTPNSRSILKTNLIGVKGGAIEIVPLSSANSLSSSPHSSSGSNTPNDNTSLTKQQKILAAANKLMNNKLETSTNPKKNALNTTPPELISLNRRPAASASQTKRPQILPKPMPSGKPTPIPPNVIVLPDTLTSQERLESKSWRPTLLPVTTTSHHLNNQQGPLYQTADGRRLPALVQVQSGGRPFLISIHDYNRMCILRREKLMRDQMLKGSKGKLKGAIFPNATCVSNNNNNKTSELQSFNKTMHSGTTAENPAKKQRQIMSKANFKIGNYTPIAPKPSQTTTTASTTPPSTCTSQQQQQLQTQPQTTMLIPPISLLSSNQPTTLSILPGFNGQVVPLLNTNASTAAAAAVTGVPPNPWLWNNFPDTNQMLMNGKAPKGAVTAMKQQQSLLLDNSLMSKIPKSLTVIPQHKLMPQTALGSSNVSGNISKD